VDEFLPISAKSPQLGKYASSLGELHSTTTFYDGDTTVTEVKMPEVDQGPFVCHLMSNGEARYRPADVDEVAGYTQVIPKDHAHQFECLEAFGLTKDEALANAECFKASKLSNPADL
jgi:hypothetical protein